MATSLVGEKEEETNLEAACRWSNIKVATYYLEKVKWPLQVLQRALNVSQGKMAALLRKAVDESLKNYSCSFCCGLFLCEKQHKVGPVEQPNN